jgi:hypothetical protein
MKLVNRLLSFTFPVKVILRKQRSNGVQVCFDRAKRIKNEGTEAYLLMNEDSFIPVPKGYETLRGKGSGVVIDVYSPIKGDYHYINFKEPENLKVSDASNRFWQNVMLKKNMMKYNTQTFMEKYASYIMLAVVGVVVGVLVFSSSQGIQKILEAVPNINPTCECIYNVTCAVQPSLPPG